MSRRDRSRTQEEYRRAWRLYMEPALGEQRVSDLALALARGGREVIQTWVTNVNAAGVGPHAIDRSVKVLGFILNLAVGVSPAANPASKKFLSSPGSFGARRANRERGRAGGDPGRHCGTAAHLPADKGADGDALCRDGRTRAHRLNFTTGLVEVRSVLERDGSVRDYPKGKKRRYGPMAVTLSMPWPVISTPSTSEDKTCSGLSGTTTTSRSGSGTRH